jgi:hypothetical protein
MSRIRKINVSQVEGNNYGVLPEGTIAAYEINGEYVLRVHDGVTEGGVPFPNAPSIVHDNDINITVNSEDSSSYTWNFGQTGTLTAPGDVVAGGESGGHFVIDGTEGNNTSVRWYNMPIDSDHSLIRAYTGNPNEETELNRGRIELAWQDSDRSGLRIISYDRSDEEDTVEHNWTFRGDGGLTLPEGGTIVEGVVTDNPTIELTPANPDVASQKLVIKGGQEPADYHLHLTTGNLEETSIFLGTDDHNVRTTTDSKIQITTPNEGTNNVWEFGTSGDLTLPNGGHIGPSGGKGAGTTYGAANGDLVSLTSYYDSGLYSSCVTAYADGTLNITAYNDGGPNPAKIWTFANDGSLTLPGDILSENAINIDINLSDSTLRRWQFGEDGDLTLPAGGDIKNSSGTSVLSAVQGEYIYEFDGINTNLTITDLNFNLLYCDPVDGYLGSDTHNVNLPAGTPGQRLVIINTSTNCTLTIDNSKEITATSGPAELIYSGADSEWIALYGLYTGP